MPPSIKENDVSTARPEASQKSSSPSTSNGETAIKQQPVALEVPVSVNGARAVEGSDKREPFSESTKTVLIFGSGAVIAFPLPLLQLSCFFLPMKDQERSCLPGRQIQELSQRERLCRA